LINANGNVRYDFCILYKNQIEYKVDMPVVMPKPGRDDDLGKRIFPAKSCADIKAWGPYNIY